MYCIHPLRMQRGDFSNFVKLTDKLSHFVAVYSNARDDIFIPSLIFK